MNKGKKIKKNKNPSERRGGVQRWGGKRSDKGGGKIKSGRPKRETGGGWTQRQAMGRRMTEEKDGEEPLRPRWLVVLEGEDLHFSLSFFSFLSTRHTEWS